MSKEKKCYTKILKKKVRKFEGQFQNVMSHKSDTLQNINVTKVIKLFKLRSSNKGKGKTAAEQKEKKRRSRKKLVETLKRIGILLK